LSFHQTPLPLGEKVETMVFSGLDEEWSQMRILCAQLPTQDGTTQAIIEAADDIA
jgi:hypothetical protein